MKKYRVGESFLVELPGEGSGGYTWQPVGLPASITAMRVELPSSMNTPGALSNAVFSIMASLPGKYNLKFEYRRNWEMEAKPEKVQNLQCVIES